MFTRPSDRAIGLKLLFGLLLLLALAGAVFSLFGILLAIMGSDSPKSGTVLPNVVMLAAALVAIGTVTLALRGLRAMAGGHARAACVYLTPPAILAAGFMAWSTS